VNAKQYHRILKRRQQRQRLAALAEEAAESGAQPLPNERSRQKAAIRRLRSDTGKFLSKVEIAAVQRAEEQGFVRHGNVIKQTHLDEIMQGRIPVQSTDDA